MQGHTLMVKDSATSVERRKRSLWLLALIAVVLLAGGIAWWVSNLTTRSTITASAPSAMVSTFRDTLSDGSQGPEMVEVPPGQFLMGSPPGEQGRFENEGPQRTVTILNTFSVGKYEVTWAEWEACVTDGGCSDNSETNYSSLTEVKYRGDAGYGRGIRPVINVDWNDAKAYVDWLTRKTGENYRLLSEAEWEYTARAGTKTTYLWGSNPNKGCTFSNGADMTAKEENKYSRWTWTTSSCTDGYGKQSAPVIGNVAEWTADCYRDNYSGAPVDGSADMQSDCAYRMQRGGEWSGGPRFLRSAYRNSKHIDYRIHIVGFRVARDMD